MSDGLEVVTVTPGKTALLESATLPLMDPVVLAPPPCANARVDIIKTPHAMMTTNL
jgi:hypothetical protein